MSQTKASHCGDDLKTVWFYFRRERLVVWRIYGVFDGLKSLTEERIAQTTEELSAAKEQEREQAGFLSC